MAAAFQSESHSTARATTTVVTAPSGVTDGDQLVVAVFSRTDTVNSVPSGWTLIDSYDQAGDGGDLKMYTYKKIAASEGASWTWGWTGSTNDKMWFALRFDGCVVDTHSIANVNNDDTPTWTNTITPTAANSLLLMMVGARGGGGNPSNISGYAIATDDPTWTERTDQSDTLIYRVSAATGPRAQTSATGDSSATITGASTGDHICNLVFLQPTQSVTVSPSVVTAAFTVQDPNVPVNASVISMTATVQAPTVSSPTPKWDNTDKTATATFSNTTKNAASPSNVSKNSSTWNNTSKTP